MTTGQPHQRPQRLFGLTIGADRGGDGVELVVLVNK